MAYNNNIRVIRRIGTFQLSQPKMYISDPSYEKDTWCTKVVDNCLPGIWKAAINTNNYIWEYDGKKSEDHRVASVYVVHESCKNNSVFRRIGFRGNSIFYESGWSLLSSQIGVDSGQCGFFDYEKYGDNDMFEFEGKCGFGSKWYSNCCDATLEHADIIANMGINAASGFGDGCYTAWGHKNADGFYDAMVLYFLPDDDPW